MSVQRTARRVTLAKLASAIIVTSTVLAGAVTVGADARTPSAADNAHAKKAELVLSDLPKGWKSSKSSNGGNSKTPGTAELARCLGVSPSLIGSNPPKVDSPQFNNSNGTLEVDDEVSVFPSVKIAAAEYKTISNTRVPTCMATLMNGPLKKQITAGAPQGTTVGTITVSHARSANFGKNTADYIVSVPISDQGISLTAKLMMVYFVNGKFGQQITYDSYGPAFPASLAKHLTTVAIGRL